MLIKDFDKMNRSILRYPHQTQINNNYENELEEIKINENFTNVGSCSCNDNYSKL